MGKGLGKMVSVRVTFCVSFCPKRPRAGVGKLWRLARCLFWQIKFYWNTAIPVRSCCLWLPPCHPSGAEELQ